MRCAEAVWQLQLYIDHRLTVAQVRTLEAHVAQCRACQSELHLLECIAGTIGTLAPVAEPADMTERIMRRVAMVEQQRQVNRFKLLRPSLWEWLAVVFLASLTTLGIIWQQPALRAVLPFFNGHDSLSLAFQNMLHMLATGDMGIVTFFLWVGGAILGIWITLALVGNDIRSEWFKAMMERLPVR
ncbi:MAG TPA: zf-HC2 domain-containing protein [Ktedonobacteraceae bacterium]|nr:zf-HC2 domain-containing protein [Ktedonobacteraceae bacterium]